MKTTNTAANTWTFATNSATVNGRTFPASYSLARNGDVYVFTALRAADGSDMPVRIHVTADMPMHAAAVAAAQAARDAAPAKAEPAPAAKADAPAPVQGKPAPVQDAPKPAKARKAKAAPAVAVKAEPAPVAKADAPAPVQDMPKPAKVRKAKPVPAAAVKAEPAPAAKADVLAPAQDKPDPVQDAPKAAPANAKPWIGTTITGKGWNIAFDEKAQRTRVLFQVQPTDAQKAAIEKAGFFWSNQLNSWNKKLTCKAHRAALELAAALNALA